MVFFFPSGRGEEGEEGETERFFFFVVFFLLFFCNIDTITICPRTGSVHKSLMNFIFFFFFFFLLFFIFTEIHSSKVKMCNIFNSFYPLRCFVV